ncbi:MBL fold metallo-hydrolase [Amphibacillus indicireducens]|uniref:MBL fold metallo-hydrolase n=1 Tax=Amphibacillus indicireducens TaxID=1076330 RepID=A0ABP7V7J3_9BACI
MKKVLVGLMVVLFMLVGCGTSMSSEHEQVEPTNQSEKETFEIENSEQDGEVADTDTESEVDQADGAVHKDVSGKLKIHFIDVGQADATLFQVGDVNVLFDAGNWNRRDVVDYLLSVGVEKIDLLIGSHPDADHIGQMPLILDQFQVDEVWMSGVESTSRTFESTIDKSLESEISYHEPRAGESYQIGELSLDVIAPAQLTNDSNEDSISVYFAFGSTGVVMTGDAGVKAERAMINARGSLSADILHAGHHGSNTSTSDSFLKAVNPDYVIISAGENNSYGHPHDEVIDRFVKSGVEIFATYQHGTIIFSSDGKSMTLDSTIDQAFAPSKQTESSASSDGLASSGSSSTTEKQLAKEPEEKLKPTETKNPPTGCVDINTASEAELMEIIHIGDVRAKDLIDFRPFKSVDDLDRVSGIGPARLKDIINQQKACVR